MSKQAATGFRKRTDYGSKWTAEFLVASELSRRGYTIAFTQGSHTANYDLLVGTPKGETFTVDVKGLASKTDWIIKRKEPQPNLFYILALVPPGGLGRDADQIFILTQAEVGLLIERYRERHPNQKAHNMSGFSWKDALPYKDGWEKLPPANQ